MKLNFPNPSRRFNATRNRVQFWGYDRSIEVFFFVGTNALKKLCPEMGDAEAGFLKAFDAARQRIHRVASEVYTRGSNGSNAYASLSLARCFTITYVTAGSQAPGFTITTASSAGPRPITDHVSASLRA